MLAFDARAGVHAASPSEPVTDTARSASASARSDAPDSNSAETSAGQQRRAVRAVVAKQRHGAVEEADLAGEVAAAVRHAPPRRRAARPARSASSGGRTTADLLREPARGLEVEADPRVGLRQLGAELGEPVACRSCRRARADFASEA